MAGCVFYKANQISQFPLDTAIQPDNQAAISYAEIVKRESRGEFENYGIMPSDFHDKLVKSILASTTIDAVQASRLIKLISG